MRENESLKKQLSDMDSNNDFRSFFEHNDAIILLVNPENLDIIFANKAACKYYGYSYDSFIKLKIIDINTMTPDEIKERATKASNTHQNYFQFKHKMSSGEIKDVEVYQSKIRFNNQDIFSIIVFDITDRLKAEKALARSEKKYRDFFEKDISGIYRSTPEGQLLDCNSAFARMTGYSIDEIKQIHTSKLYPTPKNREKIIAKLKKKKSLINQDTDLLTKDGEIIHCMQNVLGIFNDEGELYQFQGYILNVSKRKKAEIALKESEARFKKLFEDLGDSVFVTVLGGENKGLILEANYAAIKQTGYTKDELLKMNIIRDLCVDGTGTISTEDWESMLNKDSIVTTVEQKKRKDGSVFWTEVIVTLIDYNGENACLSINHDITSRIESNFALEESEKKFRELFEKSGDAFLILKNRNFIDCNDAAVNMLKYKSKKEFINVHPSKLSPEFQPDGKPSTKKANEMMDLCIEKGTHRFEWNHVRSNGEVFPAEVLLTAISNAPGNEVIHTVWRDITINNEYKKELIKAKETAEQSEKKFRELYEKSGDSVFILSNGIFTDCNEATVKLFGYKNKQEVLGKSPSELSPENQSKGEISEKMAMKMIDIAIKNGTNRFEWDHKKKNGEVFPAEILLTAITNDDENVIVHAVCRDITERKQNQLDLIDAKEQAEESDRLKSAFLANMSHEIRTPMNGILGFASLLKLPNLNREQLQKYVTIIEKSGIRMLSIINDLMDISKIEAGQMEVHLDTVNINDQIEYLYAFFLPEAEKEELKLIQNCSLPNEDAFLKTDNEKLYAILVNLLKNSIKYSDSGSISFGYEDRDKELLFYVKDTGMGIPENRHDAIFDRFVQADIEDSKAMEGAGLGLAISKAYVEMLNGRIWLESKVGRGTTFYFTIPKVFDEPIINKPDQGNNEMVESVNANKKINVLIVDDETFARTFLKIVITDISNEIFTASNGIEAVDTCKANPQIDLILMDIKMPKMDGYTAIREIRKFNTDVTIIAQTAYALPGDYKKSLEAGSNGYISKPIDKEELLEKIKNYCG